MRIVLKYHGPGNRWRVWSKAVSFVTDYKTAYFFKKHEAYIDESFLADWLLNS